MVFRVAVSPSDGVGDAMSNVGNPVGHVLELSHVYCQKLVKVRSCPVF